jgi:hypothetical protein
MNPQIGRHGRIIIDIAQISFVGGYMPWKPVFAERGSISGCWRGSMEGSRRGWEVIPPGGEPQAAAVVQ